ncbi:MAG: aldo/keto reductase [Lachnospiraceae bacterium]|nr:aldo/keto reductase [Lachnospiraceae bacterium]
MPNESEILRDPVINAIAKTHGKSAAQVIILWHLQKGFWVVPGSSNPAHIQENIESFTFTLSDDEMKQIAALNKEKRYFNMSYEQIKAWMGDYELWD